MFYLSDVLLQELYFVLTGVFSTIAHQLIYYHGAGGGGLSMITVLPNYIGMMCGLLQSKDIRYNFKTNKHSKNAHIHCICASLADFFGSVSTAIGLFYVGSGLYQVLYSSVVVFTAIISRIFLQKPLSRNQWIAVFLVNIGLGLSTGSSIFGSNSDNILFGSFFVMFGTILISSSYVIDQKIIDEGILSGIELCIYRGCYSSILTLFYIICYTMPHFRELIMDQVEFMDGSWIFIIIIFILLCVSSVLHNSSYFYILKDVGSVTAGVLQALRAVLVFFMSSLLFCSEHSEQCFNLNKAISSCIVIGSVILFITSPIRLKRTLASEV